MLPFESILEQLEGAINNYKATPTEENKMHINLYAATALITHVCHRFIHVGGKLFWKTSGTGANTEATGYKLEKIR